MLFKIHRKYLFSKINAVAIVLVIFLVTVTYLLSARINLSSSENWLNRKEWWESFYNIVVFSEKFIIILLSSYLMGSSFLGTNDNYSVLFLRNKNDRYYYYFSKVLTVECCIIIINSIICLISLIIAYSVASWFTNFLILCKTYFYFSLLGIIYGFLSIIFVLLFKTHISLILPFIIFIISETVVDIKDIQIFDTLFWLLIPIIKTNLSVSSFFHFAILIFLYGGISSLLYYHIDIL